MAVVVALARAGLRRGAALFGLAAVVALGLGVAIASLEAAARTEQAYPDYLRRADVGELVVNPSLITKRAEEIISSTPGVLGYVSDSLLNAGDDSEQPTAEATMANAATQLRMSTDGRYITHDRPVIREGRMIRSGPEAFVNAEMADGLGLRIGSTLPLAFYPNTYTGDGSDDVEPIGRTEVRVVGIGLFQDEVLADGLYPRRRILVTEDVGSPYDCVFDEPDPADTRSFEEVATAITPPGCAMSYRYYSLRIAGGAGGVGKVADALATRFEAENEGLPAPLREAGVGYTLIPTVMADDTLRVQRSLEPAVRSLQLFSLAAMTATIVVALLGAMRIARRDEHDHRIWRDLGVARVTRIAGAAAPLVLAAAGGLTGAVGVGWLASGVGPVGSVRQLDAGRLGLSAGPVLAIVGASALLLVAGAVAAAVVVSTPRARRVGAAATPSRMMARITGPSAGLGVRAAVNGPGSRALLAASVTVVSTVLATLVFSASLTGLVSQPERFGWPYDIAAMVNFGYGGTTDAAAVAATLDRPEVERWGFAAMASMTIGGDTVPFVAARAGFGAMELPVVSGALPDADDEIALGSLTARRLGLGVGDKATVQTFFGDREATIRGLVVLPPVGPLQSDRASLGTGALLSQEFVDALLVDAAAESGGDPADLGDEQSGLVAIDLRPDVDRAEFLDAIDDQLAGWDTTGARPFVHPEPVRPATVANVAAMQAVPRLLAGLLALTMCVGLTLAVAVAVRGRRRELAMLRALGCMGRQLRATVRWQSLTVAGTGLLVGMPLGVALGRVTYGAFADRLGVRPDTIVSASWLALVVVGTAAMGLAASVLPGRHASRLAPAVVLRQE